MSKKVSMLSTTIAILFLIGFVVLSVDAFFFDKLERFKKINIPNFFSGFSNFLPGLSNVLIPLVGVSPFVPIGTCLQIGANFVCRNKAFMSLLSLGI